MHTEVVGLWLTVT